jgi:hypothetical protein
MPISVAARASAGPLVRPGGFARSPRQREWDQDQAAWEARLRKLQGRVIAEDVIVPQIPLAPNILERAERVGRLDAVLLPRSLPAFVGSERGDLACAGCSAIVGRSITARTARREHPEGRRLVVRCTCGVFNLVCSNRARSGR